ncbi:MAG: hypothetical protein JXQ29_05035 [Planctomycetes bacterium]|nr:hypothetical protein [Planctomycetota bacterium]
MLRHVDALLRGLGRHAVGGGRVPWVSVLVLGSATGFGYGAVMGFWGGRPLQAFYSGVKVPILLGLSTLICLPSFFVLNTVLGLRDDFAAACRGVLVAQGTVAVALAGLAPLTAVAYLSSSDYALATVLNGGMFALAAIGGQAMLARHYRPLIAANPRHRIGLAVWLVLYVFVAVQLAWMLRPFVGAPGLPTAFFRDEAWGNAYVHVFEAVRQLLR